SRRVVFDPGSRTQRSDEPLGTWILGIFQPVLEPVMTLTWSLRSPGIACALLLITGLAPAGCASQPPSRAAPGTSDSTRSAESASDARPGAPAQSTEQHVCPCKLQMQSIPHRCAESSDDSCMAYPTPVGALNRVLAEN